MTNFKATDFKVEGFKAENFKGDFCQRIIRKPSVTEAAEEILATRCVQLHRI